MPNITMQEILDAAREASRRTRSVEIPAWGISVEVRKVSVAEADEVAKRAGGDNVEAGKQLIRLGLAVGPGVGEVDELLKLMDLETLGVLVEAIAEYNGLGKSQEGREDSFPVGRAVSPSGGKPGGLAQVPEVPDRPGAPDDGGAASGGDG